MKLFAVFSSAPALNKAIACLAHQAGSSIRYEVLRLEDLTVDAPQPALVSTSGQISSSEMRTLVYYPCQIVKALLGRGLSHQQVNPLIEAFGNKEQILVLYPTPGLLDWASLLHEAGASQVIATQALVSSNAPVAP